MPIPAAADLPPPPAVVETRPEDVGSTPLPTLAWTALQVVPSPELAFGNRGTLFGLRWQLTPIAHSFGIHRRLSPWRFLVVEPVVRHSGSVELFFSPEWLPSSERPLLWRAGLRSYFPLLQRGEYLSASLGSSYARHGSDPAASYEVGLFTLFGFLGALVTVTPGHAEAKLTATLSLRAF